jgi:DNA recombination protein RmuC
LEKAQKKINEADQEINKLVTTRTRMLMSKLRKVEQIEPSEPEVEENREEDDLFKIQ